MWRILQVVRGEINVFEPCEDGGLQRETAGEFTCVVHPLQGVREYIRAYDSYEDSVQSCTNRGISFLCVF